MSSNFDLTSKFSEFLDVHQLLKIFNFYEAQEIFSKEEILNARLALLAKTNMVGFAVEVRKNAGLEVPSEMEAQATQLMETLTELKTKHPFLSLFDAERRDELLKIGENWNFPYLAQHHKVSSVTCFICFFFGLLELTRRSTRKTWRPSIAWPSGTSRWVSTKKPRCNCATFAP